MKSSLFDADCLADQLGKNKDEVESWTPYPGGAPANVATALARLGVHSLFLSAIGKDELGDNFITLLTGKSLPLVRDGFFFYIPLAELVECQWSLTNF